MPGRTVVTSTVRFRGWGSKITIKAPPARSVIGFEDLLQMEGAMPATPRLPVPVPLPGRER
ncbi:hypothetical protein [Planomonospora venezuelensis]|uniref:Uncharacterized protein n=1 Tax=Planomonospora venezuelensis TaxID=1999 RepID=A0A841DGM4_PLAVE|nr:hypothetical protein [Planomonospora venezuelensis]MBB5967524.1 hypothetical protein [Planomonospora venezuelensis]GIN04806.1 hypothetical protein Pve01_64640 [Planomonospora venezuelensis]